MATTVGLIDDCCAADAPNAERGRGISLPVIHAGAAEMHNISPQKITIVRPPVMVPRWSDSGPLTPPIGPAYLAASLRQAGHLPSIVDGVGENPFQTTPLFGNRITAIGLRSEEIAARVPDDTCYVGVTCMFSQDWPEVARLVRLIRERLPHVPIIAGGEHITAAPEYTIETCPAVDYCVLGEGEETFVQLVNTLSCGGDVSTVHGIVYRGSAGQMERTPRRERIRGVDAIPSPAWDLVPLENYHAHGLGYGVDRGRSMPILASRGCPFDCTFCSSPAMWTTRWEARSPDSVLDEIAEYMAVYGATNFDFYDLTAIVKRDWILEFARLVLERDMQFTWQLPSGTRSEAIDAEVTRMLYESGCRNITYAPESGAPSVLKRIRKKVKLPRMCESIRAALHNGLNIKLNIIMGFPDETRGEIARTIAFLAKMAAMGVHDASVSLFTPYPGSALFDELTARGRLPELSDEFMISLGIYKDFSRACSFDDAVGPRELNVYRLIGLLTFYGTQFTLRPWRLARTLYNLKSNRQESRLDRSLRDMVHRMKADQSAGAMTPQSV